MLTYTQLHKQLSSNKSKSCTKRNKGAPRKSNASTSTGRPRRIRNRRLHRRMRINPSCTRPLVRTSPFKHSDSVDHEIMRNHTEIVLSENIIVDIVSPACSISISTVEDISSVNIMDQPSVQPIPVSECQELIAYSSTEDTLVHCESASYISYCMKSEIEDEHFSETLKTKIENKIPKKGLIKKILKFFICSKTQNKY